MLRVGNDAIGETAAQLAVDVRHSVLLRNFSQIADPVDPTRRIEIIQVRLRILSQWLQSRMEDHEIDTRPIFRGLADIIDHGVLPGVEAVGIVIGQQTFMDTECSDAGLDHFLVSRVHQLLVVKAVGELAIGKRIADGVAFPSDRLLHGDAAVHLFEPALDTWIDDRLAPHAARATEFVHQVLGAFHLWI